MKGPADRGYATIPSVSPGPSAPATAPAGWRSSLRARFPADFVSKVGETFATRLLVLATGMLTTVAVTRALGPEGRGFYAVAGAVGALGVQLGNLGLHASNTYTVARDRSRLSVLLGNSLIVGLGAGGAGAALAGIFFFAWPDLAPVRGALLRLSLLSIPIGIAFLLLQNLLLGIQRVRAYNGLDGMTKLGSLLLILLLLLLHRGTPVSFYAVGLAVSAGGLVWAFRALRKEADGPIRVSRQTFRDTLGYGAKAYMGAFFAFLVLRIDLLMVKYMAGPEQAGYYSIAVAMADLLYMVPVVVGTILFPTLSATADPAERWILARKSRSSVALLMLVLVLAAAALAYPATRLLFGRAFEPSVPAFLALLPGIWLIGVNIIYMNYFAACGMPPVTVISPGLAAVVNVLLNLVLIPKWGIVGASVSSSVCYGLMLFLSAAYMRTGGRRLAR